MLRLEAICICNFLCRGYWSELSVSGSITLFCKLSKPKRKKIESFHQYYSSFTRFSLQFLFADLFLKIHCWHNWCVCAFTVDGYGSICELELCFWWGSIWKFPSLSPALLPGENGENLHMKIFVQFSARAAGAGKYFFIQLRNKRRHWRSALEWKEYKECECVSWVCVFSCCCWPAGGPAYIAYERCNEWNWLRASSRLKAGRRRQPECQSWLWQAAGCHLPGYTWLPGCQAAWNISQHFPAAYTQGNWTRL